MRYTRRWPETGDRVALIAQDCVDWVIADFATFFAGCVCVPLFPTQALDHTAYILKHSDAKLLFIDSETSLKRLTEANVPMPRAIVFEGDGDDSFAAFERRGAEIHTQHPELPAAYEAALATDALAVLIYTSGTTGDPKGVMLSHDNIGFDAQSLVGMLEKIEPGQDVISVLPFSHIYEHTMIYIYLLAKVRHNICRDANHLLRDLQEVRPSGMTCVPRIFDRVLAGVTGAAMKAGGLQAKLVPWALRAGREYMYAQTFERGATLGQLLQYAIAKRLVLKKVRQRLGRDRLEYFTSGSAALHTDVAMTYLALGLPIMQGYGLTETSPVITVNRYSLNRYGTVGQPIPGVDVKIAPAQFEEVVSREGLARLVGESVKERYAERERELGDELMRALERHEMLLVIDTQWKDHLLSIDHLKEGIGLRGYGQRDPLTEYKKEAFDLFQDMVERVKGAVVERLFKVQVVRDAPMDLPAMTAWADARETRGELPSQPGAPSMAPARPAPNPRPPIARRPERRSGATIPATAAPGRSGAAARFLPRPASRSRPGKPTLWPIIRSVKSGSSPETTTGAPATPARYDTAATTIAAGAAPGYEAATTRPPASLATSFAMAASVRKGSPRSALCAAASTSQVLVRMSISLSTIIHWIACRVASAAPKVWRSLA